MEEAISWREVTGFCLVFLLVCPLYGGLSIGFLLDHDIKNNFD
ncbi:hypothetical protein [Neobacillus drentensis]